MKKKAEPPEFETNLMRDMDRIERMNPVNYTAGDLMVAIGQKYLLEQTVPLAIEILEGHPLAQGNLYPGDLLATVVKLPLSFWTDHPPLKSKLTHILQTLDRVEFDRWTIEGIDHWLKN